MRIVHVVSQIGTYGGERFVGALASAQQRAGLDVAVLTLYDSPYVLPNVPVYSARRFSRGAARGGGLSFFFRTVALLRHVKPTIVHTHLAHAKHWGRLAAIVAGVPCIVHTEHAGDSNESPIKRALTRLLHRRTAAIVALSPHHAERVARLENVPPQSVSVIPNGVDPAEHATSRTELRARLGVAPETAVALAVGRLDAVKGYDRALDAIALLSGVHLAIAGDGNLGETLRARAAELGIAARVHFLGYRGDARDLLPAADALLNASQSEAMPLSILEALCAGVPVAATPWPGALELVGDAGCVAGDFSAQSLALALARALEPGARARARDAAPAALARYAIDATAAAYRDLYRCLTDVAQYPAATGQRSLPVQGNPR